jgi:hypothetical protein
MWMHLIPLDFLAALCDAVAGLGLGIGVNRLVTRREGKQASRAASGNATHGS